MRVAFSLLLGTLLAQAQDLRPRGGAGWDGFKPGTSMRVKRTWLSAKQVPRVIITTWTLTKAGPKQLTIETTAANAFGIETKKTIQVPRSGEAGEGEAAKTEKLKNEVIFTAGKKFDCARTRVTVTGPNGRRVITEWTSLTAPRMRIKRAEEYFTATGQAAGRYSLVLMATDSVRTVGAKRLPCLEYSSLRDQAGVRYRGTSFVSRAVPGYEVRSDVELTDKEGRRLASMRVQLLEFTVK